MTKVIEIDLSSMFAKDAERKNRENVLIKLAKPKSTAAVEVAYLLAGIISDAADGYAFKDGHDDIMITDAVKRIVEIVEANA